MKNCPDSDDSKKHQLESVPMNLVVGEKLLDSLFDGVYSVNTDRRITYWNAGAERISGYPRESVIGLCCASNLLRHVDDEGRELCLDQCPLSATMRDGSAREAKVYLHHRLGYRVPVLIRTSPVRDEQGAIIGAVEIFSDNSNSLQILQEYEKLRHEAFLDALTGVGNRKYGEVSLSSRMYDLHTHDVPLGVLFIDIDHFKFFNDRHGHKTGDEVLAMVARSISNSLRKFDVVARWGGEEFIVLVPGATGVTVKALAERIRMLIENSFIMIGAEKLQVTISIGATISREGDTADTIVCRADGLMYLSKERGRNRVTQDEVPID